MIVRQGTHLVTTTLEIISHRLEGFLFSEKDRISNDKRGPYEDKFVRKFFVLSSFSVYFYGTNEFCMGTLFRVCVAVNEDHTRKD